MRKKKTAIARVKLILLAGTVHKFVMLAIFWRGVMARSVVSFGRLTALLVELQMNGVPVYINVRVCVKCTYPACGIASEHALLTILESYVAAHRTAVSSLASLRCPGFLRNSTQEWRLGRLKIVAVSYNGEGTSEDGLYLQSTSQRDYGHSS